MNDTFTLGGKEFSSRFILGSGKYSLDLIRAAVEHAGAQIITLALRRANQGGEANILDYIPQGVTLLPNTSASSALRGWHANVAAAILSKSKLSAIPNICCRTTMRR